MSPRASVNILAGLALAGLIACNGGKSAIAYERVPADVHPWSAGASSNVAGFGGAGTGSSSATAAGGVSSTGGSPPDMVGGGSSVDSGAEIDSGVLAQLIGAPLISAPTRTSFLLNAVIARGKPNSLGAQLRKHGLQWQPAVPPDSSEVDVAQWRFDGLEAGQRYEYQLIDAEHGGVTIYAGLVTTQRDPGATFTFSVMTDSHIEPPDAVYTGDGPEQTLRAVAQDIASAQPDFIINMGDMLDFHYFGFNAPPPDRSYARGAYLRYRRSLGDALGNAAHFAVIGNWEGEDGFYTDDQIDRARSQRLLYVPGPTPSTYAESGSQTQDYYAFTWGDALFVVLNVMSYTTTPHLLSSNPGVPDDWTLGTAQMAWLQRTLANATAKWRFLFIHHTVGGEAGDFSNSAYGRGGGQAAHVGEQAVIHDLMLEHGVQIFFYGHDHVFTDMIVDGVHYTLPGSAGAPWKFSASETGYTSYWTDSGFGRVEVSPAAVNVQFVASGGRVIYEYQLP